MRKIFSVITILLIIFLLILTVKVSAAPLSTLNITLDKTVVNPDGTVTVIIEYGQDIGAATFEVDYDTALFDFQSSTGTTSHSDIGGVVTAIFTDITGGSNPSTEMRLTFKAKSGITTSNPTQFSITANGLANADGSVTYDDIIVPIIKDILVEPVYINYNIEINYTGTIMPNVEHPINISIKSAMGRYYDHLRLVAQVTKPDGSTFTLMGTDSALLEHDVIQTGWGAAAGFGLGGNVNETYNFRGTFSMEGKYTLTLNLIDRDDSDAIIATLTKEINVGEQLANAPEPTEQLPTELPKTGGNSYVIALMVISAIGLAYYVTIKKH